MHTVSNGYKNSNCRRPEKKQQMNSEWNKVQGYRIIYKLEEQMYTKQFLVAMKSAFQL